MWNRVAAVAVGRAASRPQRYRRVANGFQAGGNQRPGSLLPLGGVALTSPAGKMTMGVIAAVVQFERDLIIERTHAGLEQGKAAGQVLGRPVDLDGHQRAAVRVDLDGGATVARAAWHHGVTALSGKP